jgi:hypothetical protein
MDEALFSWPKLGLAKWVKHCTILFLFGKIVQTLTN